MIQVQKLYSNHFTLSRRNRRFDKIVGDIIKEAIDCSIINRLSFWDALIVAAAESANCEKLWTEDLNEDQVIRGVRIENPLSV